MTTQASKRRMSVYISSGSEDSGTDSEVERKKMTKRSGVTLISTCDHQPSSKKQVQRMKGGRTKQCKNILTKLMDQPGCWLFNNPVDPVLFGIPDYFDVIRNPMDLGTVKKKLSNKSYCSTDEFAADVRLTFSNAMKYNPPGNEVHTAAEKLNIIFDLEWRSYERKQRHRNPVPDHLLMNVIKARTAVISKPATLAPKSLVACSNSLAKKTLTDAISSKVKIKFSVRGSAQISSRSVKDTPSQPAGSIESALHTSMPCTNVLENTKMSRMQSSEYSSQSNGNESRSCSDTSTSPSASFGQCSFGDESYLHAEPLSPTKALRAAMLKRRFAGTIVKAQQKALLDHGKTIDPAKLQMEKERLEKRQLEEKARIEAQVKAAEAAAQFKLDEEIKRKREQERLTARLALQMMKKTVDIDNSDFLKDLENMTKKWELNAPGKIIVDFVHGIDLPLGLGSPLERLGLFMKKDLEEEVDHEMEDSISPSMDVDVEEGEINCCQ